MIKITGCTHDLIDDITEHLGSLSIQECELDVGLSDEVEEEIFNIYIDEKRCMVVYNDKDLTIVRFDVVDGSRHIHIDDFRYLGVTIA